MTLATTTQKKRYSGNGATTVFAYDFKILDETHLEVYVADADDTSTLLTLSTHYTVSGVGEETGGNVTLLDLTAICGAAELPATWTLTINRAVPLTQETDLTNQGGFYPETHETVFDRLVMMIQGLAEQLTRAVKVSVTSGDTGDVLEESFLSLAEETLAAKNAAAVSATAASGSASTAAASSASASGYATAAANSALSAAASALSATTSASHAAGYAADAEAARDAVLVSSWEGTGSAGNTITISGFILDTSKNNLQVYVDGERVPPSAFTRTSDTVISLDSALSGGENIVVYSATAASSTGYDGSLPQLDPDTADEIDGPLEDTDVFLGWRGGNVFKALSTRFWSYVASKIAAIGTSGNIALLDDKAGLADSGADINALLPAGGTENQVLTKDSGTDRDVSWKDLPAASGVPAGTILDYAGSTAPDGYLLCYGQNVSRTTYAALFTAIGTTYGSGDGSTTFTVPDMRGRVTAGKDNMGGSSASRLYQQVSGSSLGAVGGEEMHTLSSTEMPYHNHDIPYYNSGSNSPYAPMALTWSSLSGNGTPTGYAGGSGAHNNVQPTIIMNRIIKT